MAVSGPLQLSTEVAICSRQGRHKPFRDPKTRREFCLLGTNQSTIPLLRPYSWSSSLSKRVHRRVGTMPSRNLDFKCHCVLNQGPPLGAAALKNATLTLTRSFTHLQGSPLIIKLASAVGFTIFALWGLGPLVRQTRNIFLRNRDSNWKNSVTYHVTTYYIQPLLLWVGAIFICRALDPIILPSEAGQVVKHRLLNFVRSLSTVLAFAYCLSSVIQQAQKFLMEANELTDTRTMGFQFAGRAVYTAVWVAAVSLFMELLGFSTQKWLTAGGLGTVLLTLAGREIFTNFLSSAMIHATRPFVLNDWIQTTIQGYDVSGTVEHVGWWSPTIIRGDDREAVHIPNHKFTVNIVRNLSQKTHWRIKTHLAISHLDVGKINNIVADMRKVLAKNPQVEQQKLHRRVFLDNIHPENQALLIMVSCFAKTSRFEEYLCVKEAILQDLLRVVRHHRARLATPIRTVQKVFSDADFDSIPFSDSLYNQRPAASQHPPVLLIEPSYKVSGDDKPKTQARPNGEEDRKTTTKSTAPDGKIDARDETTSSTDSKSRETETPEEATKSTSDPKLNDSNAARQVTPTAPKKPILEENIVLGVALEGSKRTLPIEEDTVPSSKVDDVKELAARNGNGPAVAQKERPNSPGSSSGDRSDQQD